MNAQPTNQNDVQQNVELRIRTMRTLWIALLMSNVMYYVFTLIAGRPENAEPNPTLSLILIGVGVTTALISFPVKSTLLGRAIQQQQVPMVQQAYITAWAISEVPALLGMVDFFVTGNRYFFDLLILSAGAQLVHFPRREHIINAWSKTPIA